MTEDSKKAIRKQNGEDRPTGEHPKTYGQRLAVIDGLLSGSSTAQIAERLGVSRARVYQIKASPNFQADWDEALAERKERIHNQLESLGSLALRVHLDIMQRSDHKHQLQAAEGILDRLSATQKTSKQQVTSTVSVDDFRGRSDDDLQHYVKHGYWPEEDAHSAD